MLSVNQKHISNDLEKLASGYCINQSKDDAAGLSISEKMRSQIVGLKQAQSNVNNGISMIETAEGALQEIHNMLTRGQELSLQAANGTYGTTERQKINDEIMNLNSEIERIGNSTNFNGIALFEKQSVSATADSYTYFFTDKYQTTPSKGQGNSISGLAVQDNHFNATEQKIADYIANVVAPNAVNQIFNTFSAFADSKNTGIELGLDFRVSDGAYNTLASVEYSVSYSTNAAGEYVPGGKIEMTLNIDLSDFPDENFTAMQYQTIAHELMHAIMDENLTNGMANRTDAFPKWFKEGVAETVGGGADRFSGSHISSSSTNAQIQNYLSNFKSDVYSAGYVTSMYLGHMASGESTLTSASVAKGLNNLFAEIKQGASLDKAIAKYTSYSGLNDFENNVASDAVQFTRDLITACGPDGVGSVITGANGLGKKGEDILQKGSVTVNSFNINTSVTRVRNTYPTDAYLMKGGGAKNDGIDYNGNTYSGTTPTPPPTPPTPPTPPPTPPTPTPLPPNTTDSEIILQIGATKEERIAIKKFDISLSALSLNLVNAYSQKSALESLQYYESARETISSIRTYFGAIENRLEHTRNNLGTTAENLIASESRIRDTDMANSMMNFTKNQILMQAAQSMLSQAGLQSQNILQLIQ